MEARAKLNYLRMSPRKVRLVVNVVRGLSVGKAEQRLTFLRKSAARPVLKLLQSAIANAENNHKLKKDNLFIKKITVDEGPVLKRWRSRAFGRASMILKRSSHITIVLGELKPQKVGKKVKKAKVTTETKKGSTAKAMDKRPIVKYEDIKQTAKGKEEAEKSPAQQKKKSLFGFKNIKERFTRRLGE